MAEQMILVCDVCGQPATDTVTIRVGGKGALKDLCAQHVSELMQGTRAPRRGRPRSKTTVASGSPTAAKRGTAGRRAGTRRGRAKATGARRGRRPTAAAAEATEG